MSGVNSINLKVSDTSGKRITMSVTRENGRVVMVLPFMKAVKKDKPLFAKKGIISVDVAQRDYTKTKNMITSYLESLFLKELENGTTDTSIRGKGNTRRTKTKLTGVSNEEACGEDSTPICDS